MDKTITEVRHGAVVLRVGDVIAVGKSTLRGGWTLDNGQWVDGWVPRGEWRITALESNTLARILPKDDRQSFGDDRRDTLAADWLFHVSQRGLVTIMNELL